MDDTVPSYRVVSGGGEAKKKNKNKNADLSLLG